MRASEHRGVASGLLAAVISVAAITVAIYGLREVVPVLSTGVVYLLAVLLVSTGWGLWFGLLTAVLSTAAFNFFHLPPENAFSIAEGENWVGLAMFLVAAGVTSTLAGAVRARARDADRKRARASSTRCSASVSESRMHSTCRRLRCTRAGRPATSAVGHFL